MLLRNPVRPCRAEFIGRCAKYLRPNQFFVIIVNRTSIARRQAVSTAGAMRRLKSRETLKFSAFHAVQGFTAKISDGKPLIL
ncbi:hypothetical protein [Immundisolibacter sp.]